MSSTSDGAQHFSSSLDGATICVLLWSGLYLWEIVRALPFNWMVLSGKRGCRWGIFVLYWPFRTLAALSFAFAIINIFPPQWQPHSALTLHYVGESVNMIARVMVYHMLTIQVAAVWKSWSVSYPLVAGMLSVWAVTAFCISRIRTDWGATIMLKVFTSCCLCLCTAIFALFVAGLIRARAQSRSNPLHQRYGQMSPWAMLREERVQFVVPLWVAQVIDSSTKLAANRISGFTAVGITCYIVIIVSGGRAYQHMVNHSDVCPMTRVPCLITSVVRSSKSRPKGGDLTDGSPVVRLSQERQHSQLFGCPHQHRRTSTSTSKCVTRHDVIELEMLNSLDRLPSAASGDTAKHPVTDESASSAEVRSVLKDADASLSP